MPILPNKRMKQIHGGTTYLVTSVLTKGGPHDHRRPASANSPPRPDSVPQNHTAVRALSPPLPIANLQFQTITRAFPNKPNEPLCRSPIKDFPHAPRKNPPK